MVSIVILSVMAPDTIPLTVQLLGHVISFRQDRLCYEHVFCLAAKWPNLKLIYVEDYFFFLFCLESYFKTFFFVTDAQDKKIECFNRWKLFQPSLIFLVKPQEHCKSLHRCYDIQQNDTQQNNYIYVNGILQNNKKCRTKIMCVIRLIVVRHYNRAGSCSTYKY